MKAKKHGFTLLELSIVLVIIGLIIGGITVGQDLIRSAELNRVISDINGYKVAMNTFKLKYNELPGDMSNASSYWTSCVTQPGNATNTCDGNGDGRIQGSQKEGMRAWQHLSLSGIVPGSFSGYSSTSGYTYEANYNAPAAVGSGLITIGEYASRNPFVFSRNDDDEPSNFEVSQSILVAAEAFQLDTKLDDGAPQSGEVEGWNGVDSGTCYNGATPAYKLDETTEGCFMLFFW